MDNRSDERLLRNEVIYLHSLWHQGPPPPPNPNPNPTPLSNRSGILHFINPATSFKKKAKTPTRLDSGIEWPVVEFIQDLPTSGWREFKSKPKPNPPIKPLSDEEQARLNSLQMQQRVLETCRGFFVAEEDEDEDEDEDEMVDGDGIESSKEYKFLVGIFMEDKELRSYYECHHENGEFFCLVCCGIGNKAPKKFKSGIALVQHSNSVSKTKQTRAHRAFGQVVCKVLGIDTNRLPVILFNCEPLGRSLGSSQEKQCSVNKENEGSSTKMNADNGKLVEETSLPVASGEVQYMAPETVDGTHDLQLVPRDACVAVEGNDELMADEDNREDVDMDHQQSAADNIGVHSQSYRQEACCADQGPSTSKLFEDNQEHVVMDNQQTNNDNKDGPSVSCIKDVCCAGEEKCVLKSFELGVCGGCAMPSSDGSAKGVGSQPDLQEDIDAQQKLIVVKEMGKCNLGDN